MLSSLDTMHAPWRTLLSGLVDYAGLFPPARLDMSAATANYHRYRLSAEHWLLGRFVVPMARLDELVECCRQLPEGLAAQGWPLSVLGSEQPMDDLDRLEQLLRSTSFLVVSYERRLDQSSQLAEFCECRPAPLDVYLEVSSDDSLEKQLDQVAALGVFGKLRLGGLSEDQFPGGQRLLAFLNACRRRGLAFKATAGLHHALRGRYPVSYEPQSPTALMHGFLNVFLTAAAVSGPGPYDESALLQLLEENQADAITADSHQIAWGDLRIDEATLSRTRQEFAHSFGSCSFEEPVAELAPWRG